MISNKTNKIMEIKKGKSASSGVAIGKILLWENNIEIKKEKIENVNEEIKRFEDTYNKVLMEMNNLIINANNNVAEIIEARKMILEDKNFIDNIKNKIKEKFSAEYSIQIISNEKIKEFESMDNDYLKARSLDIKDISNKLISILSNVENKIIPNEPSIIVADEITPEDVSSADNEKIIGFITKNGAITSHSAIVASNLGIPYIFGIDFDKNEIVNTDFAIIDSNNAIFILNPDNETVEKYNKIINEEEKTKKDNKNLVKEFDKKLSDCGIKVYANIADSKDVDMAIENGASGIGLYRTEFLYMKNDNVPTEGEQFEAYKSVVEKMGNKETIIRTMDVGADKEAKCLNLPHEENPALGRRAIRICLDDTKLFRTQLRALFRAAVYGNEKIMFPMIASINEINDIKEQMKIAENELKEKNIKYKIPPIGIMIETPAAAILSKELANEVDFFSIGTNDLTQYTLAVDRTGKNLERYYRIDDEAVMRLIKMTVDGAKESGIEVGICGEMAGNVNIVSKLYEIGVTELSMAPSKIFNVKKTICEYVDNKTANNNMKVDDGIVAPVDGEIISMENIPDSAFSSGALGKCIGINPDNGYVYAPCDGVITTIAETKHAIGIKTIVNKEVLIHIGIDTVTLNGKGFDVKIKEGDKISKGDLIVDFDIDVIKKANLSPMVIIAVTKE